MTSESPPMTGQTGCLQGQDRSAVTYPSSSHARHCFICYLAITAVPDTLRNWLYRVPGPEIFNDDLGDCFHASSLTLETLSHAPSLTLETLLSRLIVDLGDSGFTPHR
ncbi:hypothetical protein J6590_042209 [Homalodisca vitripennis]|nr:hypothetical protein J6590_042209 [Homalodisca vitripennis]